MTVYGKYTPELTAKMSECRKQGLSLKEIAQRFDRSPNAVRTAFRRWGVTKEIYKPGKSRADEYKRSIHAQVHPVRAPDYLLIERDLRRNEPRTLSMQLFGDPVRSQSALGRSAMVSAKTESH